MATSALSPAAGSTMRGAQAKGMARSKSLGQMVATNCAESSRMLCNLQNGLKELEQQIVLDQKSLNEVDRTIEMMKLDAARLGRKIAEEEAIVEAMSPEKGLGSAIRQFDTLVGNVRRTYTDLRHRHTESMDLLKREFGYNPAYKRGRVPDEYTSAYFTMPKDPNKRPSP